MYYDSDFASVEWNDSAKTAVLSWKKFAKGDDFRTPCSKALELDKEKGAKNWYSNTQLLGVLVDEDTKWFMENIVAGMLEQGIKRQALVVPKSALSSMSLKRAVEDAAKIGLETQFFGNPEEALAWLEENS